MTGSSIAQVIAVILVELLSVSISLFYLLAMSVLQLSYQIVVLICNLLLGLSVLFLKVSDLFTISSFLLFKKSSVFGISFSNCVDVLSFDVLNQLLMPLLQINSQIIVELLLRLKIALELGFLFSEKAFILIDFLGVDILKLSNLAYIFLHLKLV